MFHSGFKSTTPLFAVLLAGIFMAGCPPPGPTAGFSVNVTSGVAPLIVQFTDSSRPGEMPITQWAWWFGDGETSSEQNPEHTYPAAGVYSVSLTVNTDTGESIDFRQDFVSVTNPAPLGEETIMLPGGVPLEMVWIPAGQFTMGSPWLEPDAIGFEHPQHQVTLTNGFWLGKYEVTQAQWSALRGNNPSEFKGDLSRPVEQVSWNDANDFILELNHLELGVFRLPSEAEWEYACRAGATTRFYWGADLSNTEIARFAWYRDNSNFTTHPVGQKIPNAWGLYDMSGNVCEWVQDWYGYYSNSGEALTDPTGPDSGSGRVFRGGGWQSPAKFCRSANRDSFGPSSADYDIGFRVAR